MKDPITQIHKSEWFTAVLALVLLVGIGYGTYRYIRLTQRIAANEVAFETAQKDYDKKLQDLDDGLYRLEKENADLNDALASGQNEFSKFQNKVSDITSTVGTLEKLSKTDPELLQKYSKVYFLNEHYVPTELAKIDQDFAYEKDRTYQIHADVDSFLDDLLNDAEDDDMHLLIASAYRTFSEQAILKQSYRVTYGAGTANSFSAEQGYSEHQLGTTVDFTTPNSGGVFIDFDKTPESKWLFDNAYKYGFVISYPKENTFYQYEPWHWRFVGVKLATKLHNDDKFFYDMDQREIDTYLAEIFDK